MPCPADPLERETVAGCSVVLLVRGLAHRRPGRDRRIVLDRPDVRGLVVVPEVHARNKKLAPGLRLEELARHTARFVEANLNVAAGPSGGGPPTDAA